MINLKWRNSFTHFSSILLFSSLLAGSACSGPSGSDITKNTNAATRPNILLIVADDLGYSDLGTYGGEIETPNIDALARRGLKFSDFHVAATCSTTRSMLLSGVDNHLNGLGGLDEGGRPRKGGQSGYEGYLNFNVVSFSSLLRDGGYHTYMVGKWHLGRTVDKGPENRGFERAFVMPGGAAAHFSDRGVVSASPKTPYREDGKPAKLPDDFYSSKFYTDKLIEYIDSHKGDNKPFFAYASYTAPHWPLQAPDKYINKYKGVYDAGYDVIRTRRLERMKKLGFFADVKSSDYTNPVARNWDDLTEAQKIRETRLMQIYAGMVDALDFNIGRLISHLDETGQLKNTVIIFMSDNGPEGNDPYVILKNRTWVPENFLTNTRDLGKPGSFSSYGPGWAAVSATPFKLYKAFSAEGGLRVPAIMVMPGMPRMAGANNLSRQFATVLDIAPTILDLAGISYPAGPYKGHEIPALQGKSLVPYLADKEKQVHDGDYVMGWELYNRRAIRKGDWKITWIDKPYGNGTWALYNLADDPGENVDLSKKYPAKLTEMIKGWNDYAQKNGVRAYDYTHLEYSNENNHYQH